MQTLPGLRTAALQYPRAHFVRTSTTIHEHYYKKNLVASVSLNSGCPSQPDGEVEREIG